MLLRCEKLPDAISHIWRLEALHITDSGFLELSQSIGKLQNLNLSWCTKLKNLPDSIGKLQKLRILNLSWCLDLKCLPDSIGSNEMLRVLTLDGTKVERLPSSITKLKNLECLGLRHCSELVELPEGIGNLDKLQDLNLEDCKKLGGMPVGIGQLSRLQKLGLFAIGKGEKFAGMSELANIFRFEEELRVTGIQHVMDTNDAHVVCLKQKTNLQRLELNWMSNEMEEVNTELQQDVLDGLEPPPGVKKLHICGYSGRQYAGWMQSQVGGGVQGFAPFPFLRVMKLCNFPNLKHLHGLVELPCLEELKLKWMPSLESISGGPFPSLVKMEMHDLPCLGEMWIVAARTRPDGEERGGCCNFTTQLGQFRVGNCLTELDISHCPKLEVKPHLPLSLQHLLLWGSEQLLQSLGQCQGSSSSPSFSHLKVLRNVKGLGFGHEWELLQHLTALESLVIERFSHIHMVPESIGELRSLQELTIRFCRSLTSLPKTMGLLTSLQELVIDSCVALQQLPDCLGELCSLRKLMINHIEGLTCLPESICRLTTSLKELEICTCMGLTSLPQGIEGLVSLEKLSIRNSGLTSLPQGMKGLVSLEKLSICICPGIQSLPEGIKGLTALMELEIRSCPNLGRRCKRGEGEDWHLISHVPYVFGLD